MSEVNNLNLIMPGNPRYQPKKLQEYFGYDYLYRTIAEVEIANLIVLHEIGVIPNEDIADLTDIVERAMLDISTTQVDATERAITKHDVRAWIMEAKSKMTPRLARWVHVLLTSYDPLDTGRILMFKRAFEKVTKPSMMQLAGFMAEMTEKNSNNLQIGRTHKQHALPITVGFWMATILSRFVGNAVKMEACADELVAKISGAVGAYNAQVGLGITERCGDIPFEDRVLGKLGLKPARISTQILPPEPLARFLFEHILQSATLGQFGRDGRNLMSSEIGEIVEVFEEGQDGSSTMAHKRNPLNFENLEGTWLKAKNEFGKVTDTLISDNQRDLVGSCIMRDFPTIPIDLQLQLETLLRRKDASSPPFISRIRVNEEACRTNFEASSHLILAEPIYIAMQMGGYAGDAHNLVNKTLTPLAQKSGRLLADELEELAKSDETVAEAYANIPPEVKELFWQPDNYTGLASVKALEIVEVSREYSAKS